MKVLLHMCCGPCSVYPVKKLKDEGHELHGIFYNPNIHPYTEYKLRLDNAKRFCDENNIPLIVIDEYDIQKFLRSTAYREDIRCQMCYSTRLERIASVAKKGNFDAFSTTLLVSPFQKHNMIKNIAEQAEKKYGVDFIYIDFRDGFKEGYSQAKEMGLYTQQYCGCIYSEEERYLGKNKKSR